MIEMDEILQQLTNNGAAIRALVLTISEEQALWKPTPETWSMVEVMEHFYNEEQIDFRKHLKEMFSDPPEPWEPYREEDYVTVEDFSQAVDGFLTEREDSLEWIKMLTAPDWDLTTQTPSGPGGKGRVLSAGDLLYSWVAHDFLHIRQINELLFAWNEKQASPYSVQYAGGW